MSIPFQSSSCDAAICVAVLHHISTRERRIRCIEELVRIVKPGGLVNVQAWAMDQEEGSRRKFAAKDVFVPFNVQPKYLQLKQTDCDRDENENELSKSEAGKSMAQLYSEAFKNAEYDDKKGLVVFQRYCHLYRQGELDEIANEVPGVHIEDSGFESGNYYIVFRVDKSEEGESS
jgi:SAM-dependent methyltransferase